MAASFQPILHNEAGLTILPTGTVKVRESKEIFDKVVAGEDIGDPARAYSARVTYGHEFVHFYQSFTTACVFNYCEEVRSLSNKFQNWLGQPDSSADVIEQLASTLSEIEMGLDAETGADPIDELGVSGRQLMEAAAVFESLRSLRPTIRFDELLDEIPKHTDGGELYGRVLGVILRVLGPKALMELTPTIVFLSLNAPVPGELFSEIISRLHKQDLSEVNALRPGDLFRTFAPSFDGSLISEFANGTRPSKTKFWNELGAKFSRCGPLDQLHLVAAHPSSLLTKSNWSDSLSSEVVQCVPPMVMFEDGLGCLQGFVKSWPDDQVRDLFQTNETIGAMYRTGFDQGYQTLCMQLECPARDVSLCHMAYPPPPPPEGNWKDCPFRARFKNRSGLNPEAFAQVYSLLQNGDGESTAI